MSSRRLALLSALALTLTPALAAADDFPRFRLGAGLGVTHFAVQTGFSPPCCQERERWTTNGPELALRGTVQLLSWLHLGVDAGAGWWLGSEQTGYRDLDIKGTLLRATPYVGFDIDAGVRIRPRIGFENFWFNATYTDQTPSGQYRREYRENSHHLGPHAGLTVALPISARLEVAGDVGAYWLDAWSTTGKVLLQASFLRRGRLRPPHEQQRLLGRDPHA